MPDPNDTAAGDQSSIGNWNGAPGSTSSGGTTTNNGSQTDTANNGSQSSTTSSTKSAEASKESTSSAPSGSSSTAGKTASTSTNRSIAPNSGENKPPVGTNTPGTTSAPGKTDKAPISSNTAAKVADPSRGIPSTPANQAGKSDFGGTGDTSVEGTSGTLNTATQSDVNQAAAANLAAGLERAILGPSLGGIVAGDTPPKPIDASVSDLLSDPTNLAPSTETMASLRSAVPPAPKVITDQVPGVLAAAMGVPPVIGSTDEFAMPATTRASAAILGNRPQPAAAPTIAGDPRAGIAPSGYPTAPAQTMIAGDPRAGIPPQGLSTQKFMGLPGDLPAQDAPASVMQEAMATTDPTLRTLIAGDPRAGMQPGAYQITQDITAPAEEAYDPLSSVRTPNQVVADAQTDMAQTGGRGRTALGGEQWRGGTAATGINGTQNVQPAGGVIDVGEPPGGLPSPEDDWSNPDEQPQIADDGTAAPSQDDSVPGDWSERKQRFAYDWDKAKQGWRDLPGKIVDAFLGGDFRNSGDLAGLQAQRGGGGPNMPDPTQGQPIDPNIARNLAMKARQGDPVARQQLALLMQAFI